MCARIKRVGTPEERKEEMLLHLKEAQEEFEQEKEAIRFRMDPEVEGEPQQEEEPGTNCIKIGLPGKLIICKRKGLWEILFS